MCLYRKLVEKGEKVRALIWRGEDTTPFEGLDIETVEGDVLDPESLKPAFKGVNKVFHLAGIISIMPGENPWSGGSTSKGRAISWQAAMRRRR